MTEIKSFGIAFALWFFTGMFGGHRVYVQERVSTLLWYWLPAFLTFGIFPVVDAFLIKGMIRKANEEAIRNRAKLGVVQ